MDAITVRIDRRFCGPPESGNGGYTAGLVAKLVDGPAEVTLRAPPPLDTEMRLEQRDGGSVLLAPDGNLVAEGRPTTVALDLPEPVSFEAAREARARYVGLHRHPYPSCFVCGNARAGEGLELFPGAVDGRRVVAAPWEPAADLGDDDGKVREEIVWASLDCPSWFGHAAFAEDVPQILLGRLAAKIVARPAVGERCVVLGWALGQEGRRILCASALFGRSGACLGYARATWIALKT